MTPSTGSFHRLWTVPKQDSSTEQNEDAAAVRAVDGGLLIAVADGATEAVYAGAWARRLDELAQPDWVGLTEAELAARLAPVRASYNPVEPGQSVPWFVQAKLDTQGSQAALLLATILPGEAGCWEVRATAVGDCCLIVLRDPGQLQAFPMETSAAFGTNPGLVSSRPQPLAVQHWATRVEANDLVMGCTDAVAQWILKCVETSRGAVVLEVLARMMEKEQALQSSPADASEIERAKNAYFGRIVALLRKVVGNVRMRDDDSTLVVFSPSGESIDAVMQQLDDWCNRVCEQPLVPKARAGEVGQ
jgi:hypothetical protein